MSAAVAARIRKSGSMTFDTRPRHSCWRRALTRGRSWKRSATRRSAYLHCDFNPSDVSTHQEAEDQSQCVLALREEIKQLLRDDRTVH